MRRVLKIIICVFMCLTGMLPAALANVSILCYHEIDGRASDVMSTSSRRLEDHIRYLQREGYRFISLAEYLAYTKGELVLPAKTVMLTFDDGYLSFYTKAYPLLQKYRVPAMLAIVNSWSNENKPSDVGRLMNWDQIREVEKSGLVTIASHTYALHKQRPINPQGTVSNIAENRLYLNHRYETDEEYERRLDHDFKKVQETFQKRLGHPLRAVVWPYGRFSGMSVRAALRNGFEATFLLNGGTNPPGEQSRLYAKRGLVYGNPDAAGLKKLLATDLDAWNSGPMRMAQVDIDSLYSKDQREMERNIAALKERLYANQIRIVALEAFADPDGDGNVDGVYFYNHQMPVVADVFNYIATALTQEGYRVVAWMPSLAAQSVVRADGSNLIAANPPQNAGWYRRATPFDPAVREKLKKLYRDLACYAPTDGVLFQDDLYMNDFEDDSIYGRAAYEKRFHQPLASLDRSNPAKMAQWTKLKTDCLNSLVRDLAAAYRENRPMGIVMRNIYTEPVLNPDAQEWFAQDFAQYLRDYDYTVVMAYPYMDKASDPQAYLKRIVEAVKRYPGAMPKVFFKIQSYDWSREKWLSEADMNRQIRELEKDGAIHIGYYPDTGVILQPIRVKAGR